jgi:hypothetical protein
MDALAGARAHASLGVAPPRRHSAPRCAAAAALAPRASAARDAGALPARRAGASAAPAPPLLGASAPPRLRGSLISPRVAAPAVPAAAPASAPALLDWLRARGLPPAAVTPGPGGLVTTRAVAAGEVLLELPDSFAVTSVDVASHPTVGPLAEGRGELVGLALWLIAERAAGDASEWCARPQVGSHSLSRFRAAPSTRTPARTSTRLGSSLAPSGTHTSGMRTPCVPHVVLTHTHATRVFGVFLTLLATCARAGRPSSPRCRARR